MSAGTSIEWTDATWNLLGGCKEVSPGCRNCYAKHMAHRFSKPGQWGHGLTVVADRGGVMWRGHAQWRPDQLEVPFSWRKPRRVFVCSTSDLFHESVPDELNAIWSARGYACCRVKNRHRPKGLTHQAGSQRL